MSKLGRFRVEWYEKIPHWTVIEADSVSHAMELVKNTNNYNPDSDPGNGVKFNVSAEETDQDITR